MSRIEYGSLRQNLRVKEHAPNQDVNAAYNEISYLKKDKRRTEQFKKLDQNSRMSKELVNSLPPQSVFTITRRCEEEPCGEISYQVVIKSRDEKNIEFGQPFSNKNEKCSYLAFCLQTKLMIRDSNGNPTENKELVESLYQNTAQLPQTRQTAA